MMISLCLISNHAGGMQCCAISSTHKKINCMLCLSTEISYSLTPSYAIVKEINNTQFMKYQNIKSLDVVSLCLTLLYRSMLVLFFMPITLV